MQEDRDKMQQRLDKWLVKFNPVKGKVIKMGKALNGPDCEYHTGETNRGMNVTLELASC